MAITRVVNSVLIALSLGGCTSVPPQPAQKPADGVSFALTYERSLKVDPCGCSMMPMGGVAREKTLVESWDAPFPLVAITAGTTFVPPSFEYHADRIDQYRAQAKAFVPKLKALGTRAIALTVEDLNLGVSALRDLERDAGFAFLSANLISGGKLAFASHVELGGFTLPVVIVGLSAAPSRYFPANAQVSVEEPEVALDRVLRALPPGDRLIVVLGNLPREVQKRMAPRFPQVRAWLGGPEGDTGRARQQISRTAIAATALDQGREVARLDLPIDAKTVALFSPEPAADTARLRNYLKAQASKWRKELARRKSVEERRELASIVEKRVGELQEIEGIPERYEPDMTPYAFQAQKLTSEIETQPQRR